MGGEVVHGAVPVVPIWLAKLVQVPASPVSQHNGTDSRPEVRLGTACEGEVLQGKQGNPNIPVVDSATFDDQQWFYGFKHHENYN